MTKLRRRIVWWTFWWYTKRIIISSLHFNNTPKYTTALCFNYFNIFLWDPIIDLFSPPRINTDLVFSFDVKFISRYFDHHPCHLFFVCFLFFCFREAYSDLLYKNSLAKFLRFGNRQWKWTCVHISILEYH